ncbi:hypothetical protein [Geodermatophilus sp. SYSU D00079]
MSSATWSRTRRDEMGTSERVSWEDCPVCHGSAAVGWRATRPVEFDCPRGCRLDGEQLRALAASLPGPRPGGGRTGV